jgi:transposase
MSGDEFARRFEIVAETRRRWSHDEKRAVVEEASGPCVNISAVARRHGIKPALLYRWRKEFGAEAASSMSLVAVVVDEPGDDGTRSSAAFEFNHTIEITLANGRTIKVPAGIDPPALKRLLATVDD